MGRHIDPDTQYEEDGKPIVNGSAYFGVANQDPVLNPITIYSDRNVTVPITNPQPTDSQGRLINEVYVAVNQYSYKVDDSLGNQQSLQMLLEPLNTVGLVTADIDMNGFKVTNAGDATGNTDYATFGQNNELYGQVVDSDGTSAPDAIVADFPVSPDALLNGQQITVNLQHGPNITTTPTLKNNAFSAKQMYKNDNESLQIGDTKGQDNHASFIFNGVLDKYQLMNPLEIPVGVISMWSGTLATIPSRYSLCDGTSGTPDLRDQFILSVGTGEDPGSTGGEADASTTATSATSGGTPAGSVTVASHTLTIAEMPSHSHDIPRGTSGSATTFFEAVDQFSTSTRSTNAEGGGGSHGHTGSTFSGSALGTHTHNSTNNFPLFYKLAFIMFTG